MTERRKLAGRKMLNCRRGGGEGGKLEWFSFREQEFPSEVVMKKIKRAALQLPWNLEILITCKNFLFFFFSFLFMGVNIIERENSPLQSRWILTTIYCIFSTILPRNTSVFPSQMKNGGRQEVSVEREKLKINLIYDFIIK